MDRTKVCNRCEMNLQESEFSKDRANRDGLRRICRTCASVAYRNRYTRDPSVFKRCATRAYERNPERQRACNARNARERYAGRAARIPRYLAEIPQD